MNESMADFERELDASFRKLSPGEIVDGVIVSVDNDAAYVDIQYHTQGIVNRSDYSEDPSFNMHSVKVGDSIKAIVLREDDGDGNVSLSVKEAVKSQAWATVKQYLDEGTILTLKVGGIVNRGVIAYVEGLRGFIPISQLALGYVEDTNEYLGKTVEAKVITVDEEKGRLVLSVRDVLSQKRKEEREHKINAIIPGTVIEGKIESIKPYGVFVEVDEGISGLVHISQLANKRVNSPGEVVKQGQLVKAKVLKVEDGKISLSMKAVEESAPAEEIDEPSITYKDEGSATTGLGALLAGIKLD